MGGPGGDNVREGVEKKEIEARQATEFFLTVRYMYIDNNGTRVIVISRSLELHSRDDLGLGRAWGS